MAWTRLLLACLALIAGATANHHVEGEACATCGPGGSPAVASHSPAVATHSVTTTSSSHGSPVYSSSSVVYNSGSSSFNPRPKPADPCFPHPCGPNTRCVITNQGKGQCHCLTGFYPKPDTVTGCGPQCTSDAECGGGLGRVCRNQKCITVQASYPGSSGGTSHRGGTTTFINTAAATVDPCSPTLDLCGRDADCQNVHGRAVCSCPPGYEGSPLIACNRGECIDNTQCPARQACRGVRCVNPCAGVCGIGAQCDVVNHKAICRCPINYVGDPFTRCNYSPAEYGGQTQVHQTGGISLGGATTRYTSVCSPSPCGDNTNCEDRNGRAICSCISNYIGSPLSGCRPECTSDAECGSHQACSQNRCRNACLGVCGENARCEAVNHRAVCTCPKYYRGSGVAGCYPECTSHVECGATQACIQLRCSDPCAGACGIDANCRVQDHTAICSCPKGYLGHPYDRCRAPAEPGVASPIACGKGTPCEQKDSPCGEGTPCEQKAAGGTTGVHQGGVVQTGKVMCSPNPCGQNADCNPGTDTRTGKLREVCTCPKGYLGDPLISCRQGECTEHSNCPASQACYNYQCVNPCLKDAGGSVCGVNALCDARAHKSICYCPDGHEGNPLTQCTLKALAKTSGGEGAEGCTHCRRKRFIQRLTRATQN